MVYVNITPIKMQMAWGWLMPSGLYNMNKIIPFPMVIYATVLFVGNIMYDQQSEIWVYLTVKYTLLKMRMVVGKLMVNHSIWGVFTWSINGISHFFPTQSLLLSSTESFRDPPCSKSLVLGPAPPWRRPGGRYAPESSALNQRRRGDRSGARPPAPAPRWHNLRRQDMVDYFFNICVYNYIYCIYIYMLQ